jgi:hypothetical protein
MNSTTPARLTVVVGLHFSKDRRCRLFFSSIAGFGSRERMQHMDKGISLLVSAACCFLALASPVTRKPMLAGLLSPDGLD